MRVGELLDFDGRAVDGGRVNRGEAVDRAVELVEGLALDHVGELRTDAGEGLLLLDDEHAMGLLHGGKHGVDVERANGAQVDDFDRDVVFLFEDVGGGERVENATAIGDDGEIGALALHIGDAERNDFFGIGNFALVAVKNGVLQEEAGIVVANGGFEQAFRVASSGGHDHLHARVVGEDVFGGVGVGGADVGAAVGGAADHDGAVDQAAGHVTDVGRVVEDLVEGDGVEGPEHELHHGTDAEHRSAHAHADEAGFGDGRVDDAVGAEFFEEAFGDLVGSMELGDFLTHEDDVFVAGEFFGKGGADGFAVSKDGHLERYKLRLGVGDRGVGLFEEKAALGGALVGIVSFPIHVFLDVVRSGEGAGFGEVGGEFRLGFGFGVDLLDQGFGENAFI